MSGGRPQLREGEHGKITIDTLPTGKVRARTSARVAGQQRPVQVTATAVDADAAREELLAKLAKLPRIYSGTTVNGRTLVSELLDIYVRRLTETDLSIQTKARYTASAGGFLKRELGHLRLHQLDANLIDEVFVELNRAHHSEAKNARVVLRAALNIARRAGAIPENYATGGSRLKKSRKRRVMALDARGVTNLFALIDADRHAVTRGPKSRKQHDDLEDILSVQLGSGGPRISEVAAFHVDDVNFETTPATIRSHRAVVYQGPSNGAPGRYLVQETTKTHQIRVLSLDAEATEVLRRRVQTAASSGLIFHVDGRPMNLNNLRRTLRRALAGTPYEGWLSTHTIRRSVGTAVARAHGASTAAAVLGHANEQVTRQSYIEEVEMAPDVSIITSSLRG